MVQYGGDEVAALVVDIGTSSTRVGYAGEDTPKVVLPTSYAATENGAAHGPDVDLYRPNAVPKSPMEDGQIKDWDAVEKNLEYALKKRLYVNAAAEHPIMVTEPTWNSKGNREKMIETIFEKFQAPAYYSVDSSVMSAFALGKGTALVIDVGESNASVVPVYDGFVLRKSFQRQPVAGQYLTDQVVKLFDAKGVDVVPSYLVKSKEPVDVGAPANATLRTERQEGATPEYHQSQVARVARDFKESILEVLPQPWGEEQFALRPPRIFEFPNGYKDEFGRERFAIPEVLFNPLNATGAGLPEAPPAGTRGIPQLVREVLDQTDVDLHTALLSNVVLTGGTTLTLGFSDRLAQEMGTFGGAARVKIGGMNSSAERIFSPWLGGSILASLGTFHQLWISREEYEEAGVGVIHRRIK